METEAATYEWRPDPDGMGGMVRVRKMISGREDVLATLGAGEMFGEMSLFDDSKRSADIVANSDGVLLRLSLDVMQRMVDKQPEVVVPFLVEVAKKMAEIYMEVLAVRFNHNVIIVAISDSHDVSCHAIGSSRLYKPVNRSLVFFLPKIVFCYKL